MPHDRIAHFEILEELGAGGMGRVFLARDLRLHRTVALKTLATGGSVDDEARRRLMTEARAASALNHPSIVTIFEVGTDDGVDFISMERVEGRTLEEILAQEGALDPERVRRWALHLAEALAVAHRAGVVHRDLKPANVMVTAEDRAKVLDFGIAKRLVMAGAPGSEDLPTVADPVMTAEGSVIGTPAYMAPEQARGTTVDARSDLFALGALLYEMLTGERAFRGRSPVEVLSAVLTETPPPPSRSVGDLPEAWDSLVKALLAKDPAERPPSAEAVAATLRTLDPPTRTAAAGDRPFGRPVGRPVGRLAAIAVAVLVAAALAATLLRWTGPQPGEADATFPEYRFRLLSPEIDGSQEQPAISPDGRFVAFVLEDEEGRSGIWISDLVGGSPRPIVAPERGGHHPRWGPSGERIVYWNDEGIWEVPAPLGGKVRRLLDRGEKPELSPDGRWLGFVADRRPWVAAADGSDPRPVPGFESTFFGNFATPTFSPDGETLLTFWPAENRPLGDLWTVPVDGSAPPRRHTELSFLGRDSFPTWTADGRWILFSSDHGGAVNIWRIPAEGGDPIAVTRGAGSDYSPTTSEDLSHLVYSNGRTFGRIRIFDPETGRERTAFERRDLLILPEVSPDGLEVAFFGRTPGAFHLFVGDLETGEVRQLTHGRGELNNHPAWSADGRWLYFYQQEPTLTYRRIPARGGPSEVVLEDWMWSRRNRSRPSPGGDRVVYTVRESGRLVETRIRDLETGEETVLGSALYVPFWSSDGETVLGATWRPNAAVRCPTDGGPCEKLLEGAWDVRPGPNGGLYVLGGSPPTISSLDASTGETRALHEVEDFYDTDFGWGIGAGGMVVHHSQSSGDLELWVGEAEP